MKKRTTQAHFALCVHNDGSEDLVPRKFYEILTDDRAAAEGLVRVIDESGEDYLYPAAHFAMVELPSKVERALAQTVELLAK